MVEEYIAIMWSSKEGYEVVNVGDLPPKDISKIVEVWEDHLGYECLLKVSGETDISFGGEKSIWRKARDQILGLDQNIKADKTELLDILKNEVSSSAYSSNQ